MSFLSTKSIASLSFDLTVGASEAHTTLESAIAAAVDGQNILVKPGTYAVSAAIAVNKQVKIVGEDVDTVIFETAGTTSDPVNMFNVSANNVALAKMTIKHKKTNNTSVEAAVVASGGGFPQTRISNFVMEQCKIEFVEFGLSVRAENWSVVGCQFTYATGSTSNSCRAIGMYGTKGDAFIKDNFLKNDVLNGTSFRPLFLTSTTGSNPNETCEGKLVIEGTTHAGPLSQFFNQDNLQSAGAGTFELQIKNNTINESNLFAGFASYVQNAGDMFSSITLSGNTISNNHNATGGKGLYGVYGNTDFRSSALIIHAENNTLGQDVYRDGWEAVNGTLVGKETAVPAFTVALDSAIPEVTPPASVFDASEILSEVTSPSEYTITAEMIAGSEAFELVLSKTELKAVTKVANDLTFSDDANWRIVGAIFKEPNSAKRVIAAFRDFDAAKAAKIRSEVEAGDVVKFHKLILSNSARDLLVLSPSDLG